MNKESKDHKENKVYKVLLVQKETKVRKVIQEKEDHKVNKVYKVLLVQKVMHLLIVTLHQNS